MACGPRLMPHQIAHRFGETCDVLPQGGQISGEVRGRVLRTCGHDSLRRGRTGASRGARSGVDCVVPIRFDGWYQAPPRLIDL